MPSTYSPNLRIELIANGEQSGSWGNTNNTNLGTLIEDAISGYVSVSVTSANQALTALNGAADQSRNMVINLTTTTLANFNVYIPPAEKIYIVRNSSAYSATIYCSTVIGNTTAAGAGVTIPAGRELFVFSDGTNVNSAIDYAPSLSLGAALGATSGGTGFSSYATGDLLVASSSTALTKLADVATGNALLSGGVGVAPSYGKVGLTTHVTGTLPVANGGTGATTSTGSGSVVLAASPALTGTPTAPTASVGTNTTQLATTAFVNAEIANDAPTKTGGGASGTWGISVTGTASNVTDVVAVINGGTGVTTKTGTGSVVLSASPALTGTPTAPTAAAGTSTTQIATTAYVQGELGTIASQDADDVTITGGTISGMTSIADTAGNVRNLPINSKTASYTPTVSDNGRVISITTGGVTVPSGVFSAGQSFSVYNNSASTQTITQGSGITLRLAIVGSTGNRSLTGYGLCTILCIASNSFVITGAGVS